MRFPFTLILSAAALLCTAALSPAAEPPLAVEIAIPHADGQPGTLKWGNVAHLSHFHVILRNLSDHSIQIWEDPPFSGHPGLSFELVDEHGEKRIIKPFFPGTTETMHRAPLSLNPNESHPIDVYFADRSIWADGFWLPPGNPTGRVTLTAVYNGFPDPASMNSTLWTGHIVSKPVECIIK